MAAIRGSYTASPNTGFAALFRFAQAPLVASQSLGMGDILWAKDESSMYIVNE
ncbi:hypothetical protein ES706_02121 [subsurface metagenome]